MKILRVNNGLIQEAEIDNTLEALQNEVDGYIENVTLVPEKVAMIVNEEGYYLGMGINLMATATKEALDKLYKKIPLMMRGRAIIRYFPADTADAVSGLLSVQYLWCWHQRWSE